MRGLSGSSSGMFSLLSGLWKYWRRRDEYSIVILGLDNAGKTTFLEQVKGNFVKSYRSLPPGKITSTVGLNIGKIDVSSVQLVLWDLGGQEDLQCLWNKYYDDCHGVIYMIDSTDRERLEKSREAFKLMISDESLVRVPLLIICNKQDLPNAMPVNELKERLRDFSDKTRARDCRVISLAALNGEGVEDAIEWLVSCVKRNIHRPPRTTDIS